MTLTHTPDYVGYMTSPNQPRPTMTSDPFLSAAERDRIAMYNEAWMDLEQRGFRAASVIRLTPWDISLDGPAHQCKKLPGVPVDPEIFNTVQPRLILSSGYSIPYTHHVITVPYITVGTRFRGHSENDSTTETKASVDVPIVLARDIVQQQNQFRSQGGIFCYEGTELPQNSTGQWFAGKGWLTSTEVVDSIEQAAHQAFSRMIQHMNSVMDQATAAHISREKELMREIRGNRFRQAVQYLMNIGSITNPPEWFTERSDSSKQKTTSCPMCKRRVDLGRVQCECHYVLDPFVGYGNVYTEESPGGLMTARRMTKTQLEKLHLYPRIKPLEEWLQDQNKQQASEEKKSKKEEAKEKGQ